MRNDLFGRDAANRAESHTFRARAVGIVEREHTRLKLAEAYAVLLAGVVRREFKLVPLGIPLSDKLYRNTSVRRAQRRFHRIAEALAEPVLHHKAVNHDIDCVLAVFIKLDLLGEVVDASVNAHAGKARALRVRENLLVASLLSADDRGKKYEPLTLRQRHDPLDDLINGLLAYRLSADRAVRHAEARIKQAEVIVYLRDRSDRGTGILRCGFLIYRYCGTESLDGIDIGLVELTEKHSGV